MQQPGSKLARGAFARVERHMSAAYFAHSLRTYGCAEAFAARRKLAYDAEGLYVASLFHDVGLFPPWRDRARPFQLVSGQFLREFLDEHKIEPARTDRLVASIEYHMRPLPSWGRGAEVGLLHVGAWMDAVSWRRWTIGDEAAKLEAEFPRGAFLTEACRLVASAVGSPAALFGMVMPDSFRKR